MRSITVIALMSLVFPATAWGAEWRIEAQFLESRLKQKAASPSLAFGSAVPKGYKTKGSIAVTTKSGERFSAEATVGDTSFTLSGVVREQRNGKIILEVEVACERIKGGDKELEFLSNSICFSAAGQKGPTRLGQRLFIGGLQECGVRDGKHYRVMRGHTFTLKKRE